MEEIVVIGADGPGSATARGARLAARQEVGVCLEYEMAGVDIDPDAAEMYFGAGSGAPGGYAWIIPLGEDVANVGVGTRPTYLRGRRLRDLLDSFISEHPIAKDKLRGGSVTAVMWGSSPPEGCRPRSRGETSSWRETPMATSGGGILWRWWGQAAGEVAARHVGGTASLREYTTRIATEMGREVDNSVRIREVVDKIMNSDRLMDALIATMARRSDEGRHEGADPRGPGEGGGPGRGPMSR